MYAIKFNPILSLKRPKTDEKNLLIFLVHLSLFKMFITLFPLDKKFLEKKFIM